MLPCGSSVESLMPCSPEAGTAVDAQNRPTLFIFALLLVQ